MFPLGRTPACSTHEMTDFNERMLCLLETGIKISTFRTILHERSRFPQHPPCRHLSFRASSRRSSTRTCVHRLAAKSCAKTPLPSTLANKSVQPSAQESSNTLSTTSWESRLKSEAQHFEGRSHTSGSIRGNWAPRPRKRFQYRRGSPKNIGKHDENKSNNLWEVLTHAAEQSTWRRKF